jgi:glycerol uptake facilitator-like aquaporin
MTFIFFGNGCIANELLSATKGHSIGFGFVSIGFGFAVGFTISMFGYCSAHLNPAVIFANWILGHIQGSYVIPLIIAEILGAFIGQILVFLCYLPHFMTVPEMEGFEKHDETSFVLKSNNHRIEKSALRIASHKPSMSKLILKVLYF